MSAFYSIVSSMLLKELTFLFVKIDHLKHDFTDLHDVQYYLPLNHILTA